jgi:hypothetical protein
MIEGSFDTLKTKFGFKFFINEKSILYSYVLTWLERSHGPPSLEIFHITVKYIMDVVYYFSQ